MFSNLIESRSHRSELKRRGSFLLFTTATYAVLLMAAGVASIYAYDAKLTEQNLEIVTLMRLVNMPTAPASVRAPIRDTSGGTDRENGNIAEREVAVARTDDPQIVPEQISSAPNLNPPLPTGTYIISGRNRDGGDGAPTVGIPGTGSPLNPKPVAVPLEQLPPPPAEKPVTTVVRKHVINSEAISLPKPAYPRLAIETRTQGSVAVQVLIDQTGKVISAQVMSGHPVLAAAAVKAAYQARFSPTIIGDQPVKVSGIITYNFVLK